MTGGAGGLRPALKRLRIDARASHQNHPGVGGLKAEFARVFRVLEHAHRSGMPEEVTDDRANNGPDAGRKRPALDPDIAKASQRQDDLLPPARPRRKAAENRHGQRDAMHDRGLLGANDPHHLRNALEQPYRVQASPFAFQRHQLVALPGNRRGVLIHARGDHDLEAACTGGLRHGSKMRYEDPILRHEVQYLRHCRAPGSNPSACL